MQKITPCLWFDMQAEDAAKYYTSIFPHSSIGKIVRYPPGQPRAGTVLTVDFELNGEKFTALNGGPEFTFNEAISFMVPVKNQAEFDDYWGKLQAGGSVLDCGWVKDKFGVAWQIAPRQVTEMISDSDPARASRAMASLMTMKRIDIAEIERAYKGELAAV